VLCYLNTDILGVDFLSIPRGERSVVLLVVLLAFLNLGRRF
jgi:hypothetical protein